MDSARIVVESYSTIVQVIHSKEFENGATCTCTVEHATLHRIDFDTKSIFDQYKSINLSSIYSVGNMRLDRTQTEQCEQRTECARCIVAVVASIANNIK